MFRMCQAVGQNVRISQLVHHNPSYTHCMDVQIEAYQQRLVFPEHRLWTVATPTPCAPHLTGSYAPVLPCKGGAMIPTIVQRGN